MADLDLPLDMYSLRARLAPVFVTVLPAAISVVAVYSASPSWWTPFWVVLTMCGGMLLLSELGRDAGKRKEPQLFDMWGGKPTTQMLRHVHPSNSAIRSRYRDKIEAVDPSIELPSACSEREDPECADDAYDAAAYMLRERTRDRKKFPLVYQALCDYGFRRNLWGLKPFGLLIATLGTVAAATTVVSRFTGDIQSIDPAGTTAVILNAVILLLWAFVITPDWVRISAFSYGEKLFASTELLTK